MSRLGFTTTAFLSWWFVVYFLLRAVAMFIQLYILSSVELGKTAALFAAAAIIVANLMGILVLKEILSPITYVGIALAITAVLLLSLK
jgi:multidrug transporter EmrE-like cation transporter